jgi:hypothetical protein
VEHTKPWQPNFRHIDKQESIVPNCIRNFFWGGKKLSIAFPLSHLCLCMHTFEHQHGPSCGSGVWRWRARLNVCFAVRCEGLERRDQVQAEKERVEGAGELVHDVVRWCPLAHWCSSSDVCLFGVQHRERPGVFTKVPFRWVEVYRRKLKSRGHDWLKLCFCSTNHSY